MDLNLKDKVVVITGSSRGIGKEMVKAFSHEGAKIVINYYRSEDDAEKIYRELISQNSDCIKIKADVRKIEDIEKLKKETISAFGRVDVLINNAGICDDCNIELMTEEQWNKVISINLTGVFLCCKVFASIMIKQKRGKIINISSLKGQEGYAKQINYSASKAGLIGLGKALAKELSKYNISVNTICPGFIVTDLNRNRLDKKKDAEERGLFPINMNLHDLLNFVVFISSDMLVSVSGQVFNIDSRILF